jgi:hypothetical protein
MSSDFVKMSSTGCYGVLIVITLSTKARKLSLFPGEINPVHTLTSHFSAVSRKLREAPYCLHHVRQSIRPRV